MKRNNEAFDNFIKFTLNGDINSNEKIVIPINFLVKQIDKILDESNHKLHTQYMELIILEYERVNNNVSIAKFTGMDENQLQIEKFKENFLLGLIENLKLINKKY